MRLPKWGNAAGSGGLGWFRAFAPRKAHLDAKIGPDRAKISARAASKPVVPVQESAVDRHHGAAHPARLVGGEEEHDVRHLLRGGGALQRLVGEELAPAAFVAELARGAR